MMDSAVRHIYMRYRSFPRTQMKQHSHAIHHLHHYDKYFEIEFIDTVWPEYMIVRLVCKNGKWSYK